MPALSAIRTSALEHLAEQLRFAPKRTVLRQIHRARALGESIELQGIYSESWVVTQITGYAPDKESSAGLVGAALLADLSALIERLCNAVHLSLVDIKEPCIGIDELAARWSITRRTVERYRRRGLLALRVLDTQGQPRIVFPLETIVRFEAQHPDLLAQAETFSRVDPDVTRVIIERARRYSTGAGLTLNAAAMRLAKRYGRSHEAVRQMLIRHDASVATPIFAQKREHIDARRKRIMFQLWRRGHSISELAQRFERSTSSIVRIVCEYRAAQLRRLDVRPVASLVDAELPISILEHPLVRSNLDPTVILDASEFVEAARSDPPPDADVERVWSLAYATLIARTHREVQGLPRFGPSSSALDEIETSLRWAVMLKVQLMRMQRGLLLRSLEERLEGPLLAQPRHRIVDLHRTAMRALGSAVDRHDPLRGGRLAAPVALALGRGLAHVGVPTALRRAASVIVLEDWPRRVAPWQRWLDPPPVLVAALDTMPSERSVIIRARFGLDGEPPMTLREVSDRLGVPARRLQGWIGDAWR